MKKIWSIYMTTVILTILFSGQIVQAESTKKASNLSEMTVKSNISLIGASKVWKLKDYRGRTITGKGIKVAVIDSGVDVKHPFLKSHIEKYIHIDGGKDLSDRQGHGTFVAGIIHQVAPDAKFYVYKLGERARVEKVIRAIEQAVEDGVQIINLSAGFEMNSPNEPIAWAIHQATQKGVSVVVAAGNEGPGRWTVSNPSTAPDAISVGATTTIQSLPSIQLANKKVGMIPVEGAPSFAKKAKSSIIEVKSLEEVQSKGHGKVVFFQRDVEPGEEIIESAIRSGAVGIIVANNKNVDWTLSLPKRLFRLPVVTVTSESGKLISQALAKGENQIEWGEDKKERIVSFSSRGPGLGGDWLMKPDLVAPGESIESTVPLNRNRKGWDVEDGTSMAAPHVTGALALLKQKHPGWSPEELRAAVCQTSNPLTMSDGREISHFEQGAGRLDVYSSIQLGTSIRSSQVHFGLIPPNTGTKKVTKGITIKNLTSERKNYQLEVAFRTHKKGVSVTIPNQYTLKPREKGELLVELKIDTALPPGAYEGTITIYDGTEIIRIPFLVWIETKVYPKITGLDAREVPHRSNVFYLYYYLPVICDELTIVAENGSNGRRYRLLSQENAKSGYHEWFWDGRSDKGKSLPDGIYTIIGKAKVEGRQTVSQTTLILDHKPPRVLIQTNTRDELIGKVSDYAGVKEMRWRFETGMKWRKIRLTRLDSEGVECQFNYAFGKGELKKGKNKIILQFWDMYGNLDEKRCVVEG